MGRSRAAPAQATILCAQCSALECSVHLIHDHGGLENYAAAVLQHQRPVFLASTQLSLNKTAYRAPAVEDMEDASATRGVP
jgi:hypothetical protein